MIIFATCQSLPDSTPSLDRLMTALRAEGASTGFHPWNDPDPTPFRTAKAVLPLCCWDYQEDMEGFEAWIADLEARGIGVLNPPSVLRWNLRKTYVLDMGAQGLSVPASIYLPDPSEAAVEAAMRDAGWRRAVLKPVSGQGGTGVEKIDLAGRANWNFGARPARESLLQEFQADIGARGETTLFFVDGVFSHAIRRNIRQGEWRANHQYGVRAEAITADARTVAEARAYLAFAPALPLYARVDGIARPEGFMLMELEAVEPYPYLELVPETAERFARAIRRRIDRAMDGRSA